MYEICWVCEPCPLLQSPDRQRFRGPYPCLGYAYSTSVNTTLQVACQWTISRRRSQGNGPCKSRPAIMTTGFLQQPAKLAINMALGRSPCGGCYWFPAQLRPAQPKGSAEGLIQLLKPVHIRQRLGQGLIESAGVEKIPGSSGCSEISQRQPPVPP